MTAPLLADSSALKKGVERSGPGRSLELDDLPESLRAGPRRPQAADVVLRVYPLPPGKTLDEAVMRPEAGLGTLEKQFVCVRVIQTKGLDLQLFQYDYDQSWTAKFLNADRTIYGRYGTRDSNGPKSDGYLTAESFPERRERALALHKAYPSNKASLAARPAATGLADAGSDPRAEGPPPVAKTVRKTCIHCHNGPREYDADEVGGEAADAGGHLCLSHASAHRPDDRH